MASSLQAFRTKSQNNARVIFRPDFCLQRPSHGFTPIHTSVLPFRPWEPDFAVDAGYPWMAWIPRRLPLFPHFLARETARHSHLSLLLDNPGIVLAFRFSWGLWLPLWLCGSGCDWWLNEGIRGSLLSKTVGWGKVLDREERRRTMIFII